MHLWQYNNEIIISQFCDTSGDINMQLFVNTTCTNYGYIVYYAYELWWTSLDNTQKRARCVWLFFNGNAYNKV